MSEQKYLTLEPNIVGTITLDNDYRDVEVINFSGNDAIYFVVADVTDGDPTIMGEDSYGLPAVISSVFVDAGNNQSNPTVVKFISESAVVVSVKAGHEG